MFPFHLQEYLIMCQNKLIEFAICYQEGNSSATQDKAGSAFGRVRTTNAKQQPTAERMQGWGFRLQLMINERQVCLRGGGDELTADR